MTRILVISGDIVPYPGLPATGAGLRAWGIAKGLEAQGHDVLLAMPHTSCPPDWTVPEALESLMYTPNEISGFIEFHRPDIVVLQHWRLANLLQHPLDIPLVIDFHGPLLLEIQFQDNPIIDKLKAEKIQALRKADFFTCAGEKQRYYFFSWLMAAGFDLREEIITSIPVSLSPELPEHQSQGETSFVYGGMFLPWQDPVSGLTTLVTCLEEHKRGVLKFFGGKHPVVTVPTGQFETLRSQLQRSPRVWMQPMIPREELIQEYCRSHVAIDIMQRNAERELAFTTRTVEYLWCGLPVIYNDYAELADYIREYNAGWTLDPHDTEALRETLDIIMTSPDIVAERGRQAQQLIRDRLTWDKTITPLDTFCRAPVKPTKGAPLLDANQRSWGRDIAYFTQKVKYHFDNEGIIATLQRGWKKFRQ